MLNFPDRFRWEIKYKIGIEIIDNQHKELFSIIDKLLAAIYEKKGKCEILKIDQYLISHIKEHLETEENLMAINNYPLYNEHKNNHEQTFQEV